MLDKGKKGHKRKKEKEEKKLPWLLVPIFWEVLFVASYLFIELRDDKGHFTLTLYFMFVFYLGLIIWYHRDFSIKEFLMQFLDVRGFIIPVLLTAAGVALAKALSGVVIAKLFPDDLMILLPLAFASTLFETILYALTLMVLMPVATELFYRKGIISFSGPAAFLLSVPVALLLESVTRGSTVPGIVQTLILALPFVISYCITKNIYVTIFVHLIFNIIINMQDVGYDIMRIYYA